MQTSIYNLEIAAEIISDFNYHILVALVSNAKNGYSTYDEVEEVYNKLFCIKAGREHLAELKRDLAEPRRYVPKRKYYRKETYRR